MQTSDIQTAIINILSGIEKAKDGRYLTTAEQRYKLGGLFQMCPAADRGEVIKATGANTAYKWIKFYEQHNKELQPQPTIQTLDSIKTPGDKRKLTIYIGDMTFKALKHLSVDLEKSMSDIVDIAVNELLQKK